MTVHRPHRRKRRRWEDLQPAGCEAKTEIHLKRGEVNPLPPQSRRGSPDGNERDMVSGDPTR